jgi:uncharacterized repeat protein (TIGR04138 family)
MVSEFILEVKKITEHDKRFDENAYEFVMESLHFYVRKNKLLPKQHVTAAQLLEGFREYALKSFGPMTRFTLDNWGIHASDDVGHIVYNMIGAGLMARTESDSLDEFRSVFDFDTVFREDYTPPDEEA